APRPLARPQGRSRPALSTRFALPASRRTRKQSSPHDTHLFFLILPVCGGRVEEPPARAGRARTSAECRKKAYSRNVTDSQRAPKRRRTTRVGARLAAPHQ